MHVSYLRADKFPEVVMSAKWNWAIDNLAIRVTANMVAFGIWFAAAVAIMEIAARQ
jgi:hypothetical protein